MNIFIYVKVNIRVTCVYVKNGLLNMDACVCVCARVCLNDACISRFAKNKLHIRLIDKHTYTCVHMYMYIGKLTCRDISKPPTTHSDIRCCTYEDVTDQVVTTRIPICEHDCKAQQTFMHKYTEIHTCTSKLTHVFVHIFISRFVYLIVQTQKFKHICIHIKKECVHA